MAWETGRRSCGADDCAAASHGGPEALNETLTLYGLWSNLASKIHV
jgi:hypothetical protein